MASEQNGRGLATSPSSFKEIRKYRSYKGMSLAQHLKMCKVNKNEGENLKSVYLTDGEIDYLIQLVLKECKNDRR